MRPRAHLGVTLIELVIVIALLGIISAVAAIAIRDPMRAYADTARRASMTDVADTALRRVARDIRGALPNSLRLTQVGSDYYLEFLPVRTGGRYRVDATGGADPLVFSQAAGDTSFNILGTPSAEAGQVIAANDILVIRNEAATGSLSNAYTFGQSGAGFNCTLASGANCNTATISGPPVASATPNEYTLTFSARTFNFDTAAAQGFGSPGNRFYVVVGPAPTGAVSYVCAPNAAVDANGDATGTLRRVSGYNIAVNQPTGAGLPAGDLLARYVSGCQISYNPNALGYTGLVVLQLKLTRNGESVTLYHEVHINNAS